jgi:hypothetical protein
MLRGVYDATTALKYPYIHIPHVDALGHPENGCVFRRILKRFAEKSCVRVTQVALKGVFNV